MNIDMILNLNMNMSIIKSEGIDTRKHMMMYMYIYLYICIHMGVSKIQGPLNGPQTSRASYVWDTQELDHPSIYGHSYMYIDIYTCM